MIKILPKQSRQLEIPLFINLNANKQINTDSCHLNIDKNHSNKQDQDIKNLEASASDLSIYKSIYDNFLLQYK